MFPSGMKVELIRNKLSLLVGSFYGPTSIFALLSLLSYFINPEIVPGRLGLLITLYLIVSNVYNSLKAPEDRGFSYLEIWMTGIQAMILFAIIQYGWVLKTLKYQKNNLQMDDMEDLKKFIAKMDKVGFFLALTLFLLFVSLYWIIALL